MAMTQTIEIGPSARSPSLEGLPAVKVVAGAGIGMATNFGPILIFTFGTFLLPIVQDTGWSRASVAMALAPAALLSGLLQPVIGRLIDRVGPRRFALGSFALFALGLIALGLLPQDATVFALCLGALGILGAGQSITGYTYVVATRFTKRRGLALGIVNACSAASIMVMPAIATGLIARYGWRGAYVAIGLAVAVLGAVAVLWLIPGGSTTRSAARAPEPYARVLGSLLRDRAFWALAGAFFFMTLAVQGTVVHFTPLLVDRGFTPASAAGVMAVYGFSMLIARFGLGALLDRGSPRAIALIGCCGPLLSCLLLSMGQGDSAVFVAAVALGVGAGAESDLLPYAVSRYADPARFGQVLGVFIFVFALGITGGPALYAWAQSHFGSYQFALYAGVGLMAIAMLLFARIRSPAMTRRGA